MSMKRTTYITYQDLIVSYLEENNIPMDQPFSITQNAKLLKMLGYNIFNKNEELPKDVELIQETPSPVEHFTKKYFDVTETYMMNYDTSLIQKLFDVYKMKPEKMFNPNEETAYDYVKKYIFPLIPQARDAILNDENSDKPRYGFRAIASIFFTILNIMEVKHHYGFLNIHDIYTSLKLDETSMMTYLHSVQEQKNREDEESQWFVMDEKQHLAKLLKGQTILKQFFLNYQQTFSKEITIPHMLQIFKPEQLTGAIIARGPVKCPMVVSKKYMQKIAALMLFFNEEQFNIRHDTIRNVYNLYVGGNVSYKMYDVHIERLKNDPIVQKYKEQCSLAYSILPKISAKSNENTLHITGQKILAFIEKTVNDDYDEINLII